MPADPVRDAAVDVLLRVFERNVHLDVSLDKTLRRKVGLSHRGRRFLTQICYGTVRYRLLCDYVLSRICTQPLDELPPAILVILRMAVFQAFFCHQVTRPAMVHTSVDLAQKRSHAGLARMTNAVLRRVPESLDLVDFPDPLEKPVEYLRLRHALPRWLVREWLERYGYESTAKLCAHVNEQAPTTLRVNLTKTTAEVLQGRLEKAGIATIPSPFLPEALLVVSGESPFETKWYEEGYFIAQDTASMLPARLLEPQPGERILDMCAAPGGKTTHMAQLSGGKAVIIAADPTPGRLHLVRENAARMDLPGITILCADGMQAPFGASTFDKILVDAPCSGLGTLRRHPDLKDRVNPETVARLAATQIRLLREALHLCKNGGLVVYSVCTFTRQETVEVTEAILEEGLCAPEDGPELLSTWKTAKGQYQTDPHDAALDGFYLMRFRKRS